MAGLSHLVDDHECPEADKSLQCRIWKAITGKWKVDNIPVHSWGRPHCTHCHSTTEKNHKIFGEQQRERSKTRRLKGETFTPTVTFHCHKSMNSTEQALVYVRHANAKKNILGLPNSKNQQVSNHKHTGHSILYQPKKSWMPQVWTKLGACTGLLRLTHIDFSTIHHMASELHVQLCKV